MATLKPHSNKGHDLGDSDAKWGTVHTGDLRTETMTASGNVTVEGDLTVTGSQIVATVDTVEAKDPLISLAKDNTGDTFDIGFYGKSVNGSSETKYHGIVRDADDSGKFKVFKDASGEPTTAVGAHSVATVVADLEVPSGSSLKVPNSAGALVDYLTTVELGTAAASKVLVLDSNKDISGIATLTAQTLSAGNITLNGNDISVSGGSPKFTSIDVDGGAIDGTPIGENAQSSAKFTTLNASGATTLDGAVTLGNAAADDITLTGSLASSIVLKADSTYNLGTNSVRMAHIYSDQITASTINAFTAGGAIDFNNENLTNVDIDSGAIDGTNITVGTGKTLDVSAGTITFADDQIPNSALANESVSFGGVSLNLGQTDDDPAFDLSHATNYPTSSLTGTITNDQLAGSIANGKLANHTISGVALGTNLSDLTVDDSSIQLNSGTTYNGGTAKTISIKAGGVSDAMLAGSIADSKLSTISTADKVSGSAVQLATASALEDSTGLRLKSAAAGDGLSLSASQALSVNVDDSSIETNSDTLRIKASGVTNAMLGGSIANDKLANSTISFGGVELALGGSDDDPAFDLTHATNYPTSSLVGTITNTQLAGSIANAKLSNSAVSITTGNALSGGGSVSLGGTLGLAVEVDDSSIEVSSDALRVKAAGITNDMLAGSIAMEKLLGSDLTLKAGSFSDDDGQIPTTAAVKQYVDNVAQGLEARPAVLVATTGNITLSGTQTIDGKAVAADDRVLVKDQSTASENGIYICKASTWERAADMAAGDHVKGHFFFVEEGAVNADNGFVCTSDATADTVGTNDLTFVQFSGAGQITAGAALTKSGNTLNVAVDDSSIQVSGDALQVKASGVTNAMLAGSIANAKLSNSAITLTAGDGLSGGGSVSLGGTAAFAVQVDDSSIELNSDSLRVKAAGITDAMLGGSIADSKLSTITTSNKVSGSAVQLNSTHSAIEDSTGLRLKSALAGDGLALTDQILSVNVDDSSIETNSDTLRIKASGVTNAMLGGSIANAKLANSSITVTAGDGLTTGGPVSLGGTVVLAANVDDSSIEISSDALQVKALGISNAMLGGSIADSKLNAITTADKVELSALKLSGETNAVTALADTDLFIVSDADNSNANSKMSASVLKSYISANAVSAGTGVAVTSEGEISIGQAVGTTSNVQFGEVTIGTNAVISETDAEKIDDITDGQGAANKALVLNSSSSITTGVTSFQATTLTDGTASLSSGALTNLTNLTVDYLQLNGRELKSTSGDLSLNATSGSVNIATDDNIVLQGTGGITAAGNVAIDGILETDAVKRKVITKTTGYQLTGDDHVVLFNVSSDATCTLPDSDDSDQGYREFVIKNVGSNTITFSSNSQIDGAVASDTTLTAGQKINLIGTAAFGYQSI